MKTTALAALTVLAVSACSGGLTESDYRDPGVQLNEPVDVTLRIGESALVGNTVLRVEIVDVIEDSRCPSDVTCVWEGNAALEVRLTMGEAPASTVRINTAVAPTSIDYDAINFTIAEVLPAPNSTMPTLPADYLVTLRFSPR